MKCLDLEMGASIATLQNIRYWGLPDPDDWTFQPYSRVEVGGDGRSRGFGFPVATWTWNFLTQQHMDVILDFFAADSDASVSMYVVTYVDTGIAKTTGRYQAILHRPVDGSGKTMISESRKPTYSDVVVSFTHLESV